MQNDVTRNHKDSLFQLAFRDNKEAALSLYNAVNGSHHTDASKLKFELLDRGIFMRMENDNGFILDQVLGLYEHQSTLNPNMPLRGFLYCADIYKGMIDRHRLLYGSKLIKINYGHNEELLNSCKLLKDYSYFVQKVRDYACDMERHDAIMKVMDECIKADIFKEVLQKYREEILRMSFWEFDEEEYKEYLISEERENTERERKRADEAEARADEAEMRAKAEKENAIVNMIATMRELGADDRMIRSKLLNLYPFCEEKVDSCIAK